MKELDNIPPGLDKEDVKLNRTIGERMREGRLLCQYSQAEASILLNIDPKILKNNEFGINISEIPSLLIYKASLTYDISTDFIYGISADWERDPAVSQQRQFGVMIHQHYAQRLSKLAVRIALQQQRIDVLNESIKSILEAVNEVNDALETFKEMNDFDDLKAGAKLAYRMSNAVEVCNTAIRLMVRNKLLPQSYLPEIEVKK